MARPNVGLSISQVGERLDLSVRQGSTLGPFRHTMYQPDGVTPMDLTGCTVLGAVRKAPREPGPTQADLVVVWPSDRTLGYYDWSIPDEITATMDVDADQVVFYWDSELIDASGRVIPLFYGDFTVLAEATREDTVAPEPEPDPCAC